jgi:hypothetical protein
MGEAEVVVVVVMVSKRAMSAMAVYIAGFVFGMYGTMIKNYWVGFYAVRIA